MSGTTFTTQHSTKSQMVTGLRTTELNLLVVCAGGKWLYGCWFYRPTETFHLATRKFLEKEVFKSDYNNKVPISKVLGKCLVMFVKVGPPPRNNPLWNLYGRDWMLFAVCRIISKCSRRDFQPTMCTSVNPATLPGARLSRRSRSGPCQPAAWSWWPVMCRYQSSVLPPCSPSRMWTNSTCRIPKGSDLWRRYDFTVLGLFGLCFMFV